MKTSQAVLSLAALAQETRLSIFRALVQSGAGGLAAGKIAEEVGGGGEADGAGADHGDSPPLPWERAGERVIHAALLVFGWQALPEQHFSVRKSISSFMAA